MPDYSLLMQDIRNHLGENHNSYKILHAMHEEAIAAGDKLPALWRRLEDRLDFVIGTYGPK